MNISQCVPVCVFGSTDTQLCLFVIWIHSHRLNRPKERERILHNETGQAWSRPGPDLQPLAPANYASLQTANASQRVKKRWEDQNKESPKRRRRLQRWNDTIKPAGETCEGWRRWHGGDTCRKRRWKEAGEGCSRMAAVVRPLADGQLAAVRVAVICVCICWELSACLLLCWRRQLRHLQHGHCQESLGK